MKRLFVCVLLLVSLTACAGVSAPSGGSCNKGLCVKVTAAEPVHMNEPVAVTITVTTDKDISGLQVSLSSYPPALVEDGQDWQEKGVRWVVDAKANRPQVFTRKVRLPSSEGVFSLTAGAYTPNLPYVADSINIHLTRAGGKVYLSGTSVPITPGPLPTLSGPTPTFVLTPTPFVSPLSMPMRPQSPLATPTRLASP